MWPQREAISPQFVKPFVKTNKNDANDAEAIVEAASRPSMNFVPIKQVAQQDIQSIHRVRSRVVKNRTALINEIRGLCLEYGITIQSGAATVKRALCNIIADSSNELTPLSRECMQGLYDELLDTEARLKGLDKKDPPALLPERSVSKIIECARRRRIDRHGHGCGGT